MAEYNTGRPRNTYAPITTSRGFQQRSEASGQQTQDRARGLPGMSEQNNLDRVFEAMQAGLARGMFGTGTQAADANFWRQHLGGASGQPTPARGGAAAALFPAPVAMLQVANSAPATPRINADQRVQLRPWEDTSAMGAYVSPQAWQAQQQNGYASRMNTGYMTGTEGVAPSPLFQQMAQQQKSMPSNWLQGGRTYAGVGRLEPGPNPNQPQAAPNFGQTAAEAQAGYLADQANTSRLTDQRIRGMIQGGTLDARNLVGIPQGGQMTYQPTGILQGGRQNEFNAGTQPKSLTVQAQADGSGYAIQGSTSRSEWNGMPSTLPGAKRPDGTIATNAEMFAQRRADMAGEKQQRKDSQALAAARMYNLDPRFAPAVYQASKRQGIQLPGMPREKAGTATTATATPTLSQAISGLQQSATDPTWETLQPGFNPAAATPSQFADFIQNTPWDKLDAETVSKIQDGLRNAAAIPNFTPNANEQQLIDALVTGGPAEVKAVMAEQKKVSDAKTRSFIEAVGRGLRPPGEKLPYKFFQ